MVDRIELDDCDLLRTSDSLPAPRVSTLTFGARDFVADVFAAASSPSAQG
jgi:hypothetical protein